MQSAVSPTARFWVGSVHVITASSLTLVCGHAAAGAPPSTEHVQPLAAAVSLVAPCGNAVTRMGCDNIHSEAAAVLGRLSLDAFGRSTRCGGWGG